MNNPAVSVIIPTYARPRQLERCLRSLAHQEFGEAWEIIVVDDGSPVAPSLDSRAILSPVTIRVLHQPNRGPASARNHGARHAKAGLLAFLDDDCEAEPTWLQRMIDRWRRHPDALVGGFTVNGLPQNILASTSQLIVDLAYEHFNQDPDNAGFLASSNLLCSRECFVAVGGFDGEFKRLGAEDRDLCNRWKAHGLRLIWCHGAIVQHRHNQTPLEFLRIHLRYGRGAYIYQRKKEKRDSGSLKEDLGFHQSIPGRLRERYQRPDQVHRLWAMAILLMAWELINAIGFGFQAIRQWLQRQPSI